jgi:hypothetical protein
MFQNVICILFLITINCKLASAQDYKRDFDALRKKNLSSSKMHIVMSVDAYSDGNSQNPFYSQRADIKRFGTNYCYRFDKAEMLMNDKYLILVDYENKEIVCSRRDVKGEAEFFAPMNLDVDSMLSVYGNPKLIGRAGDIVNYRFSQHGEIQTIDLFIDLVSVELRKIVYHYKDGQVVIIRFEKFNINPKLDESDFDEDRYITKIEGVLRPSTGFVNFSISDEGL